MNKLHTTFKEHAIPICLLVMFTFLISLTTDFGYLSNGGYLHDNAIFAQIGNEMAHGKILYTQIWENKGPLLYFINMIGVSINYWHGIYFIELISLFITLIFSYKAALIVTQNNKWVSFISTLASGLILVQTLSAGNLSEEYALPFMAISLYLITKFFYNNRNLKIYELIIVGACFAAVFLLRANMCAFFVAMILVILIVLIRKREWKTLLKASGFVIVGIVLFLIPFLIYFIYNNALSECIKVAYLDIMNGYVKLDTITIIKNVFSMIKSLVITGAPFFAVIFIINFITHIANKNINVSSLKYVLWFSTLGLIFNLLANSIAGVYHMHYFITFVPIMIIPCAWTFNSLYSYIARTTSFKYNASLLLFTTILFITFSSWTVLGDLTIANKVEDNSEKEAKRITSYVTLNTTPNDKIQFIGSDVTIYFRTQRMTASKHIHFAAGIFTNEFKQNVANEIFDGMKLSNPKLVVFPTENVLKNFVSYLNNKNEWDSWISDNYEKQDTELNRLVYKRIID